MTNTSVEQPASAIVRTSLGRRLGFALGGLAIIGSAILVLGAHAPSIPWVGALGSLALSLWTAWFIVLPPMGLALMRKCGSGGGVFATFAAITALSMIGAAAVLMSLLVLARENGVRVSWTEPFGFSGSLEVIKPDEVVTYLRDLDEELTLRIYKPRAAAPAGGWPVFMHVHGGGWVSGNNAEQSADMRWFADQGWVVISVGYNLSSDKRHLWDRTVHQIGCAMAWTQANISARGGDINRLAMRGGSAGGNLALNAAYMANAGTLKSSCGGSIPRVRSVVPIYPATDLVAIYENPYIPNGPEVRNMAIQYTGGTPSQFPERYDFVGSATHISPAAPPTLIFETENDHLVPLASVRKFAGQVRAVGIPLKIITVPYGEHGFDFTGIGNAVVRQASLRFIQQHDVKALTITHLGGGK